MWLEQSSVAQPFSVSTKNSKPTHVNVKGQEFHKFSVFQIVSFHNSFRPGRRLDELFIVYPTYAFKQHLNAAVNGRLRFVIFCFCLLPVIKFGKMIGVILVMPIFIVFFYSNGFYGKIRFASSLAELAEQLPKGCMEFINVPPDVYRYDFGLKASESQFRYRAP